MKIFYFEQHPQKNYLWRLTSSASQRYADIVENTGFCREEYYTKELSDQMYKDIEELNISQVLQAQQIQENKNVIDLHSTRLKQMYFALLAQDHSKFLRTKNLFI